MFGHYQYGSEHLNVTFDPTHHEQIASYGYDDEGRPATREYLIRHGRLIQDGELGPVVKNPNYRGVSAEFWRRLDGVGDPATFQVLGVATCGKGEPNQSIPVGHAAPACRFRGVAVFGGE